MKLDLNGKVVIVTGGGGAIGSAMCHRFAENGAKVAVAGRTLSKLEKVETASKKLYYGDNELPDVPVETIKITKATLYKA